MLKSGFAAVALFGLLVTVPRRAQAQQAPPAATPAAQTPSLQNSPAPDAREANAAPGHKVGGFVPGQKRPPGDPAQIARGKTLFGVNCRS
jgi:cytochrome c oxidase cbb3-type subunit 3